MYKLLNLNNLSPPKQIERTLNVLSDLFVLKIIGFFSIIIKDIIKSKPRLFGTCYFRVASLIFSR